MRPVRTLDRYLALLPLLMAASPAHALSFSIINRSSVSPSLTDPIANDLETIVNQTLFPPGMDQPFLRAMGNASATATRGLGTDPVPQEPKMSLSARGGVALETPKDGQNGTGPQANSLPALGAGIQTSLTLGFPAASLGLTDRFLGLDVTQLKFYADFMSLNLGHFSNGVSLSFATGGIHGQYLVNPPTVLSPYLDWTGLSVSTGLEYSHLSVTYSTPLSFSTSGSGIGMSYHANLDLGVNTSIFTLPIEATTGVTLLRVLTFYGGLGVDVNAGSSKLEGNVTGPVVATDGAGKTVFSGTGIFDANSPTGVGPQALDGRVFLGLRLDAWAARLFSQVTFSSPSTVGVLLGLGAAW